MPLVVNATFAVLSNVEAQPGVSTASDGFGMINEPTAGANFFGGFFLGVFLAESSLMYD